MTKRVGKIFTHSFKLVLIFLAFSCSNEGSDDVSPPINEDVIPTDIVLTVDIIGSDSSNPNGDGSGAINVNITATNAVKFGFKFENDNVVENSSGNFSKVITQAGTNNYLISAFAYSSTNNSISTFNNITVLVVDDGELQLVWSDEFSVNGAPNESNWVYEIGDGGWGNNEVQYYTDRSENIITENGFLKIIPRKENYLGSEYTSARITTQGKFNFKYGKVEIRAKLPASQGTWPALWMLGSNFQSVGWPICGEIDIMEQTGWDKNTVLATCHWQNPDDSSTASYGTTTSSTSSTTAFHVYSLEWTETQIKIFIDDVEYYVLDLNETLPFDNSFFFIFNVAMGGSLGGDIDSLFTQDTMEVDYIRVYQ